MEKTWNLANHVTTISLLSDGPANHLVSSPIFTAFFPPWDKFTWSVKISQSNAKPSKQRGYNSPTKKHTKLCIFTTQCIYLFFTEGIPLCL